MRVNKAVIPAAGLGTRFLPATKAIPKEMLPVVDKPAIQYVVEEAVAGHCDDILIINGRGKTSIEDHFDKAWELEATLEAKGDLERLGQVKASNRMAQVHFLRQGDPLGLGHAVLCAKDHVGNEPFAVLLGDDLIDERDPILPAMAAVQGAIGGSVIALLEVEPSQIHLYGSVGVKDGSQAAKDAAREASEGRVGENDVFEVTELIEKPAAHQALSNLAIIGRYVLDPAVFEVLEHTKPGKGGEIQLTDALVALAKMPAEKGGGVTGIVFRGRRYDTGDRLDYLKANITVALDRPDLGPQFRQWLVEYAKDLSGKPETLLP